MVTFEVQEIPCKNRTEPDYGSTSPMYYFDLIKLDAEDSDRPDWIGCGDNLTGVWIGLYIRAVSHIAASWHIWFCGELDRI